MAKEIHSAAAGATGADLSPWDAAADDKMKTEHGLAVPCRTCEMLFGRIRLTTRYCSVCKKGYCEGEHGSITVSGPFAFRGVCLRCLSIP